MDSLDCHKTNIDKSLEAEMTKGTTSGHGIGLCPDERRSLSLFPAGDLGRKVDEIFSPPPPRKNDFLHFLSCRSGASALK
jgi:hypothetical protein